MSRKLPSEEPRQYNQRRVIRRIRIDPVTNTATDVSSKFFKNLRNILYVKLKSCHNIDNNNWLAFFNHHDNYTY